MNCETPPINNSDESHERNQARMNCEKIVFIAVSLTSSMRIKQEWIARPRFVYLVNFNHVRIKQEWIASLCLLTNNEVSSHLNQARMNCELIEQKLHYWRSLGESSKNELRVIQYLLRQALHDRNQARMNCEIYTQLPATAGEPKTESSKNELRVNPVKQLYTPHQPMNQARMNCEPMTNVFFRTKWAFESSKNELRAASRILVVVASPQESSKNELRAGN